MQINSSEKFPIVRKLSDPSDAGTYYVRATVRNSLTGATISTVDLEDSGGQRFVVLYVAPTDASGQGLWIDVVTKVYSDSGYTTQDTVYADETETYLVQERFNHNLANQFGGPVGPDVDYKKIKKIIEEVFTPSKEVDLSQLNSKLDLIESKIKPIEMPKPINLEPVFSAINEAKIMIEKIPTVDISPVISKINELKHEIEDREEEKENKMENKEIERKENSERSQEEKRKFHDEMRGEIKNLVERVNELSSVLENTEFTARISLPEKKNESKLSAMTKSLM